ncbi:MAG: hypothetical protein ACR5K9_05265 [Wolbachia sp.]
MGYVINLLNFPIIAKKSSFSFVPLPMKLGISYSKIYEIFSRCVVIPTFVIGKTNGICYKLA